MPPSFATLGGSALLAAALAVAVAVGTTSGSGAAAADAASGGGADEPIATTADSTCSDHDEHCPFWASQGECDNNPEYMRRQCASSCGCPTVEPSPECVDRDKSGACAHWAAIGECDANPSFMKLRCAASCNTCDLLDYKKRCPIDANRTPAVPPGRMDEIFERALGSEFAALEPRVLSREPWVVEFERFLSPDEIAVLLKHGEDRFVRSTASGGRKDDEFVPLTSEIRTSWTTWCDNTTCTEDETVKRITERVADVTQVPSTNFEFLQLLRYLPCEHERHPDCQFYRRHHDTIPELATMQPGPRVFTFFLYLSDVEEGGGTKFDGGFTVYPRAGKGLLWPATLPHEPFVSDDRTHHEALPVLKGVKYAGNFWIHQFDYVGPHFAGCTS